MTTQLLALDCGTQSIRALVFNLQGDLLAKAQVPLSHYTAPQPGWLEADAEGFWSACIEACRALVQSHPEALSNLAGVAVTTQRGTVLPVDAEGRALSPAITWLDQRKASRLPAMPWYWRAAFALADVSDTVRHFQKEAEANWLAEHAEEIWAKTHRLLLVSGWLNFKLTGQYRDSVGSQVGYLPFDYKKQRWAAPGDWKWKAMSLRPEQLPELVPVGGLIGAVSAQAAQATGLPEGLPVIAAAADKACEILGSGALDPEVAALSYGTTATVNLTLPRYVEPTPWLPPYPAAVPEHFSLEVQIFRGFWMVSWFKENFGAAEALKAEASGQIVEQLFDELVATVPPGSLGLMLQPYWSPGVRFPGPAAKGAIIGFGDVHTRAHFYRAILEGLAYALREGLERIEQRSGCRVQRLRVSGGGSQSDAALQLTADVFHRPVERPHTFETSGLGAAMNVAVGLGLQPSYAEAVARMSRVGRVFEPNAKDAALYDRLYRQVYRKMYDRLSPLYNEIQSITGYPRLGD